MKINNFYEGEYKRYMLLPAALFIVFIVVIAFFPGIKQGIDLKGGTNIIVRADKALDTAVIRPVLEEKYSLTELQLGSVSSPTSNGLFIQFLEEKGLGEASRLFESARSSLAADPENAKSLALQSIAYSAKYHAVDDAAVLSPADAVAAAGTALGKAEESFQLGLQETIREAYGLGGDIAYQKREIRPSLGESFFGLAMLVTVLGFLGIVFVVFISFREFVPSAAIIAAIIFDIVGALAGMAIFQVPLSLTTIPALLMMIGYSVDTDILLTTRVLKRRDSNARQRAHDSMITGLTMTMATLAALAVMLTLSYYSQLQVIFEISAVLLFGIFADIIATWLMNAPMLLSYFEKKEAAR
ncbi:MAG: hypothetical protein HY544_04625 [Candidatus Diapherotrites archaeon]|uniref:Protein-export membrane protein SecF n=1 Tax=Candidatus Iainarchaeum sp. TaxID=3101447 RepID=A0A8T3YLV0_9ARCH|nr:hypothetical protein [Candidatus Diapherotrites archaeon]